jgi:hypothetical protein
MTGPNAVTPTNTAALGTIGGTDLGASWDAGNGTIIAVFGDTYSRETTSGNWRCSSGLISSDTDLSDGVAWDSAIKADPSDQYSAQLVPCNKDAGGSSAIKPGEHSAIPTGGFAVPNPNNPTEYRNFVGYMSNTGFGAAGYWGVQYSEIYYSDDYGMTWSQAPLKWVNTAGSGNYHPFSMINFAQQPGDPWVYMFGTGGGRHTPVAVARVLSEDFYAMDQSKFEYWITDRWVSPAEDAQADSHATPVMGNFTDHGVGELGIGYDQWTHSWVSFHQDNDFSIVLQTAPAPTGPWSDPEIVVHVDDYPQLYGGFIHPWSLGDDPDLYFAMSDWNKYNTFLVRVTVNRDGSLTRPNLVVDPNFERSSTLSGSTASFSSAWQNNAEAAGVDRATAQANNGNRPYSGWHSAWIRLSGDPEDGDASLFQTITVKPNTDYRAWGEVKYNDDTAANVSGPAVEDAHFGIRQLDGQVLVQTDFNKTCTNPAAVEGDANCGSNATFYARQDVVFNSGNNTEIQIFVGGPRQEANPYMNIDTFGLLELAPTGVDRSALAQAIAAAETKNPNDYTEATAAAFADALAAARAALASALATQAEVTQATTELLAATEALQLKPPGPELQVTVTPRCGAGKAQVSVTVRNQEESAAVEISISSPLGATKSFASVTHGKSASNAFTTRLTALEDGVVTVTGKLLPDGATGSQTFNYSGVDCG